MELRETSGVLAPVELSRVDNDTSDGCSVATDPFGGRVDDDISAMVDRTDEVTSSTKSVVNNDRNALLVSGLRNSFEVRNVILGVTDTLNINSLCLIVNGSSDILGLVTVDKLGVDAETGEEDLELVVSAAIKVRGRNNVVAGLGEGGDGEELGCLA
jgi:hypothetical protein